MRTGEGSPADPGLVGQIIRLRNGMRAFSDQLRTGRGSANASTVPQPGFDAASPAIDLPDRACPDCSRELGRIPSSMATGSTSLPGFPEHPHLYHLGATGFFLDHANHLGLRIEQRTRLGELREQALLARARSTRDIEEANQVLFELTGADQPDIEKVESQIRRVEALRRSRRLAFIRAVGEAAQVLDEDQRHVIAAGKS